MKNITRQRRTEYRMGRNMFLCTMMRRGIVTVGVRPMPDFSDLFCRQER